MLTRLQVKNFKSIGEKGVDIALTPLTILVGPNGGGKSSIVQAIALMVQNLGSGELYEIRHVNDLIHRREAGRVMELIIHLGPRGHIGRRVRLRDTQPSWDYVNPVGNNIGDSQAVDRANATWSQFQQRTFFISSVRGDIPYRAGTGGAPTWVGSQGQNLLRLLGSIFGQRKYDAVARKIASWAGVFGIEGLKAGLWESSQIGSDYVEPTLDVFLDLALASSGSRQILTVVTQLLWASQESQIIVEEPEISLHPQAQVDLVRLLAEAVAEQKQIIITTHSQFLLLALSKAIQEQQLTASDVSIYHVSKAPEGTSTQPLKLDEYGYVQGWIPSFSEVERELVHRWVDSLPED